MYNCLNENNSQPACVSKWNQKLSTNYNMNDWKTFFSIPFTVTNDRKMQWFQIRILHRIIGTNDFLYKIKYIENNLCTFCRQKAETIEHLFWECGLSKTVWQSLRIFQPDMFSTLDIENVVFGFRQPSAKAKNLVIISAKMYIFQCRAKSCKPSILGVKQYINFQYDICKQAAVERNLLEDFNQIWRAFHY